MEQTEEFETKGNRLADINTRNVDAFIKSVKSKSSSDQSKDGDENLGDDGKPVSPLDVSKTGNFPSWQIPLVQKVDQMLNKPSESKVTLATKLTEVFMEGTQLEAMQTLIKLDEAGFNDFRVPKGSAKLAELAQLAVSSVLEGEKNPQELKAIFTELEAAARAVKEIEDAETKSEMDGITDQIDHTVSEGFFFLFFLFFFLGGLSLRASAPSSCALCFCLYCWFRHSPFIHSFSGFFSPFQINSKTNSKCNPICLSVLIFLTFLRLMINCGLSILLNTKVLSPKFWIRRMTVSLVVAPTSMI
jgi:hypothetical protein